MKNDLFFFPSGIGNICFYFKKKMKQIPPPCCVEEKKSSHSAFHGSYCENLPLFFDGAVFRLPMLWSSPSASFFFRWEKKYRRDELPWPINSGLTDPPTPLAQLGQGFFFKRVD